MTGPKCAFEGCSNDATQKCSGCGKPLCIAHVSYLKKEIAPTPDGWICKSCTKKLIIKTKKTRDTLGWILLISILLGTFMLVLEQVLPYNAGLFISSYLGWIAIPVILVVVFIPAFLIIYGIAFSQQNSFFKKNFSA